LVLWTLFYEHPSWSDSDILFHFLMTNVLALDKSDCLMQPILDRIHRNFIIQKTQRIYIETGLYRIERV
jgi:hypothetical protein